MSTHLAAAFFLKTFIYKIIIFCRLESDQKKKIVKLCHCHATIS